MRSSRILGFFVLGEEGMSDVELTPVREAHKFDTQALERYMQEHVEGHTR